MKRIARFLLPLLPALAGCASTGALSGSWPVVSSWPEGRWPTSGPEAQGMDPGMLASVVEAVVDENLPVHGLLVVRHGVVVLDVAFPPFGRDDRHDVASVTKSVTGTLVGIALARGEIRSLDQPVLDFFPERAARITDPRQRTLTIRDLLTMQSGLDCHLAGGSDIPLLLRMMRSRDWAGFILDVPMARRPGTRFQYCSLASQLLSVILHRATGRSAAEYAREFLFEPVGIRSADWPVEPATGDAHGWGDLALTRHDMARFGYLYLSEGRWQGRQVVPAAWVRAALSRQVPIEPFGPLDGYGYHWWTGSGGLGVALGRGDQWIVVAPRAGLVVVLTGAEAGAATARKAELVQKLILGAIRGDSPIAPDPAGDARLHAAVARAESARDPIPGPALALPAMARSIADLPYDLDANDYGLRSVSVRFPADGEAAVLLEQEGAASMDVRVGLDGAWRSSPGRRGYPARARGHWEDDHTLVVELDELALINRWTLRLSFEGDRVDVRLEDASGNPPASFGGRRRSVPSRPITP